jgi:hypothetical protein
MRRVNLIATLGLVVASTSYAHKLPVKGDSMRKKTKSESADA